MSAAQSDTGLPEKTLSDYLEKNIAGFHGPLQATKFDVGQSNPTYRIDADSGQYVLRRKPAGVLLPSAHAIDREYRVLKALHGSAVPVAEPIHLCEDTQIIGSMFYLMSYVPSRVFWDPALPQIDVAQRAAYFEEMLRILAGIHTINIETAGLQNFAKPGNYFARQINRWSEQYRASELGKIEAMEMLIAQLPLRCPPDDGSIALVHGDFRIDNLLWHPEKPHVLAVVDWELATLGHPLADLGYLCMALRLPRNPTLPGLAGVDRQALGIPDETQILEIYRRHGGKLALEHWNMILAFSFFRLAAIAQGVAKRAAAGNASNANAAQVGQMVGVLAKLGIDILQ